MGESQVRIGIYGDDKASPTIKSVQGLLRGLATDAKSSILAGVGLGAGVTAFGALKGAIGGVTDFLGDAVHGAIEDEASVTRLTASLKANVPAWTGNTAAIEKRITAGQKLGFTDDAQRASLALLVAATHDVTKAQEIQATAMDLARLKGISLEDASNALIKVEGGRYRILASLGIKLRDGATATEALAAVQKVAAGQAKAFGDTTAGATESAGIAFDELKEDIGKELMPVVRDLAKLARDDLVPALAATVKAVKDAKPLFEAFGRGVDAAMTPLRLALTPIGLVAGAIGDMLPKAAKEGMDNTAAALREGGSVVKNAAQENIADPIWQAAYDAKQKAQQEAAGIPKAMGDAMLQKEKDLGDSIKTLLEFTKAALIPAQTDAAAIAFLTSKAYADALASGKPAAIAKANELANAALVTLYGAVSSGAAARGGAAVAQAWIDALNASLKSGVAITASYVYKYQKLLGGSLPEEGPLKGDTAEKGGLAISTAWLQGLKKGLGGGMLNLPKLPALGAMPSPSAFGLATAGTASGGGGQVIELHVHSYLDGREVAENVSRHQYYGQSGASRFPRG